MFATFAGMFIFLLRILVAHQVYTDLFHETYGFSAGIGGLAYLGLGIGFFVSTIFGAKWADAAYKHASVPHHPPFRQS